MELVLSSMLLLSLQAPACEPAWAPTFGGPGLDDVVYSQVVFDDGSGPALYVGGSFRRAGEVAANRVAKWDGTSWSALGSGVSAAVECSVFALAVYDDGSGPALYAAGDFTSAGGGAASRIAKWDGAAWSPLGSGIGASGTVRALAAFDEGSGPELYAGGSFSSVGGIETSGIARWDGASWSSVGGGITGSSSARNVQALSVFDDGSGDALYVGGGFTSAGGVPASRIARWNGAWSAVGSGANNAVLALTVYDGGGGPALHAGGLFTSAGGVAANGIVRWNGAAWSALGSGANPVYTLAVHDAGGGPELYAGGQFASAGGAAAANVARWNGSTWSPVGGGTGGIVNSLAVFDDGGGPALCAGGSFRTAGGASANFVARWDGAWSVLGGGSHRTLSGSVSALLPFDDGSGPGLYAAGAFTRAGEVPANRIARWDGTSWSALAGGLGTHLGESVACLAVFDDGGGPALYAGGTFDSADGLLASGIAKWDGTGWSALGIGTFPGPTVRAMATFDDGGGPALFVSCDTGFGGGASPVLVEWDGVNWAALSSMPSGRVECLAVFDDGGGPALYAGGSFLTTTTGATVNRVARWDGAQWSALGTGLDQTVRALTVFDDGGGPALYAGGSFVAIMGGATVNRVARWDGASWSALGTGITGGPFSTVAALTAFDDGSGPALYAGGTFSSAGGAPAQNLARWSGSHWSALGSGATGPVVALAAFGGPSLYAGGPFQHMLDSLDRSIARWQACPDTTAPTIVHPASVAVADPPSGAPGEVVHFTVTASDASDPAPVVVCVPPSGSLFPRGSTVVTCTATDASGNQATAEFVVQVQAKARRRP